MTSHPRPRLASSVRASAGLSLAVLFAVLLTLSAVPSASAGSSTWTQLGLAEKYLAAVAVAPGNPSLILASSDGSIYRSADRGKTWSEVVTKGLDGQGGNATQLEFDPQNANVAYAVVGADPVLAIDPQNPNTLYSGTPTQSVREYYRSTDGGKTWSSIAARGSSSPTSPVLKSTDRGETWQETGPKVVVERSTVDPWPPEIFGVAVKPTNSQVLVSDGHGKTSLQVIQRSSDGGKSWQKASLPGADASGLVYSSDGKALFTEQTVYRSLDDGQTWQLVLGTPGADSQSVSGLRVLPNPTNPNEVFARGRVGVGQSGIYRSGDKGATFAEVVAPSVRSIQGLAFDRSTPQTLYAATSDGVWAYTASSMPVPTPSPTATRAVEGTPASVPTARAEHSTWTNLGLDGAQPIQSVSVSPADANVLLAVTGYPYGGVGLCRSENGGKTWTQVRGWGNGGNWRPVQFDPQDPKIVYVAVVEGIGNGGERNVPTVDPKAFCGPAAADGAGPVDSPLGLYRSLDGGKTWDRVLEGLVDSFVVDPKDSSILHVVVYGNDIRHGVYRSGDRGKTWTKSLALGPLLLMRPLKPESTLFELDPQNSQIAYVSIEGGLYRSADSGKTWKRTLEGDWNQIVFNPASPSIVYALGRTPTSPLMQYHVSSDRGLTWRSLATELAGDKIEVNSIAVHQTNPRLLLAKGSKTNSPPTDADMPAGALLIRSTDGGASWRDVTSPVQGRGFWPPTLNSSGSIIFDYGAGVVLRSLDQGATWTIVLSDPKLNIIATLVASRDDPDTVLVIQPQVSLRNGGTSPGAIYRSTNAGASFTQLECPSSSASCSNVYFVVDQSNRHALYVSTVGGLWAYALGKSATASSAPAPTETTRPTTVPPTAASIAQAAATPTSSATQVVAPTELKKASVSQDLQPTPTPGVESRAGSTIPVLAALGGVVVLLGGVFAWRVGRRPRR